MERRSFPALAWLAARPAWLPALVLGGLLLAGLWWGGLVGGSLLLVLAAYAGWLAYLSWPAVATRGRLWRLAAVGLLLAAAVISVVTR